MTKPQSLVQVSSHMEQYGSESEACIFNSITPVSPPSELGVFMTKPQSLVQVSSHMEQYESDSELSLHA